MPCPVVAWHVQGWWRHIPPSDCQLHFFISLLQRQCQHVEAEGLFLFSLYHHSLGCTLSRFQLGHRIPWTCEIIPGSKSLQEAKLSGNSYYSSCSFFTNGESFQKPHLGNGKLVFEAEIFIPRKRQISSFFYGLRQNFWTVLHSVICSLLSLWLFLHIFSWLSSIGTRDNVKGTDLYDKLVHRRKRWCVVVSCARKIKSRKTP